MAYKQISSAQNPRFLELKKLLSSKGIHKQKSFFLWGEKFVNEILATSSEVAQQLIVSPQHEIKSNLPILELSNELFKELDVFGTHSPILVCQLPELLEWQNKTPSGLELLVAMSDPSNLGAVIRSSASFNVKKIILLKESASPFHPRSVRASAGNILKIKYEIGPSIHELNQCLGEPLSQYCLALDMNGENLAHFKWPKSSYLLVGEEGRGIPANLKLRKIQIPTGEACVESLNAGVALSIAMYTHYLQKLGPYRVDG